MSDYRTTYMYFGNEENIKKICNMMVNLLGNFKITENYKITDDNYLLFFKIQTQFMINLKNKQNKTCDEMLMSCAIESIFKTKSSLVTNKLNILNITNIIIILIIIQRYQFNRMEMK